MLFGHGLVIHGFIAVGIGIELAAHGGDAFGVFTRRHSRRAFEHHVFQHMAQACFAGFLVHAADFVPKLRHHHRRTGIFAHDDFQAIVQCFADGFRENRRAYRCTCKCQRPNS